MTFREKSNLAVQVLRESMAFCWRNWVLWQYVALFFCSMIVVGGGSGVLSHVLGKTFMARLTVALFVSVFIVGLFWIIIAFLQKVTTLLQGRSLTLRESFNISSQFMWQFVLGLFLLSCAYSLFMFPFKLIPPASLFYWFLLFIGCVGYWLVALVAALFNPILFSERTRAIPALKKSMVFVRRYWDVMTITYAVLILVIAVPLIFLVKIMYPIIFTALTVFLLPFVLIWVMYAFLLVSIFWFVFYNKIKRF